MKYQGGRLDPLTETGRFHIALLHLNRPALVSYRLQKRLIELREARRLLLGCVPSDIFGSDRRNRTMKYKLRSNPRWNPPSGFIEPSRPRDSGEQDAEPDLPMTGF